MNERTNGQRNVTYTVTKNKENHDANELSNNTITVTSFISSFFLYSFFLPGVLLNGRLVSQLMIPATSITVVRNQLVTLKCYHRSVLHERFLD